jgi:HAE1 family hydrophobic/amphiphilic exporter-1
MVELRKERRAKKKAVKRAKKAGQPAPAQQAQTASDEEPEPAKA